MNVPPQLLWMAAVALGTSALALMLFGSGRRRYAGWWWWVGSLLALAAGLASAALAATSGWVGLAAEWLLLQWPILSVIGVRRFHARLALPAGLRWDAAVGAAAAVAVGASLFGSADGAQAALIPAATSMAVHLYAAALLLCGPADSEGTAMRWLGATLAAAALVPALWTLPTVGALPTLGVRGLAALLAATVMAFVVAAMVGDRTERQLRESRRRLRMLANIDSLTHVPTRRHFGELAARVLAADPPGSAALVLFDVDHFKQVNDNLGHAAGDRALRLVARCVQDVLRTDDVPGRHGGDEFVMLLRRATSAEAIAVADRIVTRVQGRTHKAGLPRLTLSFGIVHLRRGEDLDDAMQRADQALYEAKRQGRSRAVAAAGHSGRAIFTDSQLLGLHAV